jgi:hypothetical protein
MLMFVVVISLVCNVRYCVKISLTKDLFYNNFTDVCFALSIVLLLLWYLLR